MKCYNKNCDLIVAHGIEWDCPNALNCAGFDDTPQNLVDHPSHYQGDYECIDLMREIYGDEAVRHFCICNAYKYRFRAGAKQTESAHDDIRKAEWYEKYIMEKVPNNYTAWADRRSQNAEQQIGAD